jgi:hypothetical protein
MSTRCRIGYKMRNEKIRSIYCHHDGYPEGVGKTLLKHYDNWNKIKPLIDLGDISCLGSTIGKKHNFDDYEDPQTTAYGRDRGEEGVKARVNGSRESYANTNKDWDIEYFYLFEDDEWEILDAGKTKWKPLKKVLGVGGISYEDDDIHGEGNPYESKQKNKSKSDLQETHMLSTEDIKKYGTKDEIKNLNEDSVPEPPATEEKLKKKEEEKAATATLLNIHLNLIDAAGLLGSLSMPKEYIDKNIVDLFNNIRMRISQLTLGEREGVQ